MAKRFTTLALVLLCTSISGCGSMFSGAKVETAKVSVEKPSTVTIYVSVTDSGNPVGYLNKNNFEVYENDVLLESEDVGLELLSRDKVASGHAILLLDLSGSPDKKELMRISRGAAHFVEKVSVTQPVTVVAFDGSERAREVASFAKVNESTKRPLPDLEPFLSKDTSRDLNGAMLAAIGGLGTSLKNQKSEVHFGTIVSLIRGPDLAGRKSDKDVTRAIKDSGYSYLSIVPDGLKFSTLHAMGSSKSYTYESIDTLPLRFQDLGMRVRDSWESHYLISYCSPARSGTRKLKVHARFDNAEGTKRNTTSKSEFDSTGFEGGCMDQRAPVVPVTAAPLEMTPPPPKTGKGRITKTKTITGESIQEPSSAQDGDGGSVVAPPSNNNYE